MARRTGTPPVRRSAGPVSTTTVDRGGRSAAGVVKLLVVAAVLVAGAAAVVSFGRSAVPALQDARHALQSLIATWTGSPSPSPPRRDAPPATASPLDLLHAAIRRGDAQAVGTRLSRVPRSELDVPESGMTALMSAASAGDPAVVRALIEAGADPNARGSQRRTALQYAAEKNRIEAAVLLLDAGADIDGVDTGSLSPLVMAADRDFTDFALLLITRGANVNIQNVDGWTALMDAAEAGNARLVKALLAAGAEPRARHRNGWTAYDFARNGKHAEAERLLARFARPATHIGTRPAPGTAPGQPAPATAPAPDLDPATGLPHKKGERL